MMTEMPHLFFGTPLSLATASIDLFLNAGASLVSQSSLAEIPDAISHFLPHTANAGSDLARIHSHSHNLLPHAALFASKAALLMQGRVSLGVRTRGQTGSLMAQLEEEMFQATVLNFGSILDVARVRSDDEFETLLPSVSVPYWKLVQYFLLAIREEGDKSGISMEGFGEEEVLAVLDLTRHVSQTEDTHRIARCLSVYPFDDVILRSIAQLWQLAGRGKWFDSDHRRQRNHFCDIVHRALQQAWEWRELRFTGIVSPNIRLAYHPNHLLSPVPMTEAVIQDPNSVHYYFLERQIENLVVRRAFGSVIEFPNAGTGFLVSAEGHVITCSHCVEKKDLKTWRSVFIQGEERPVEKVEVLSVRKSKKGSDLALLHIPELAGVEPIPLPTLGNSRSEIGFSIGYPSPLRFLDEPPLEVLSVGRVSERGGNHFFSGETQPGHSGSPVIDENGQLMGVVFSTWKPSPEAFQQVASIAPVEEVAELLAERGIVPRFLP